MWEKLHCCPSFTVRHCSGFWPSNSPRHTFTAWGGWVAEHDKEEEAWSCWFMTKEKTNRMFIGVTDEDQEVHRRGAMKKKRWECLLFYELKKRNKIQDLRKKRRERRWENSGSYRLCSSYNLVSYEWNMLTKVKKKCSRSLNCLILLWKT